MSDELNSYRRAPYPTSAEVDRLAAAGRFDEAELLNGIVLTISNYRRLGGEDRNVRITPRVASNNVEDGKEEYRDGLRQSRVDWDVRTGRITGRSEHYTSIAASLERDIVARGRDFPARIQQQYARINSCYGQAMQFSQSTQACIASIMACIERLQRQQQTWDEQDRRNISLMRSRASHYAGLEAEARRLGTSDDDDREPASETGQDDLEDMPRRNPTVAEVPENGGQQWYGQGQGQQQGPNTWGNTLMPQGQGQGWYGQGQGQGQFQQPQGGQGWYNGQQQFGAQGNFNQFGQQPGFNQFGQAQGNAFFGQNLGVGASFNNFQNQFGQGQGQGWYGQNQFQTAPGMYPPGVMPVQGQGGYFGQQQFGNFGPVSTQPFMAQPGNFMNPGYQNFGSPGAGTGLWYQ